MASVRKSPTRKGTIRWQAIWNEPGPGGRTRQRTKNFTRQSEARDHAARMAQEVERRGVGDPQRHSVERFLKRWLTTLEARGEHSPTTITSYRRNIGIACRHIGHVALERLSPDDLDGLYTTLLQSGGVSRRADGEARPLNPRTVLHVHRVLHKAFEQARKWRFIGENPCRDATAPKPGNSPVKAFEEDEVDRLLAIAASDRETYAIVITLLITGLRRSELLGLAWDAVDLEHVTVTIKRVVLDVDRAPVLRETGKSENSQRTIAIPPLLVDLLRVQKAHCLEAALLWGKGYRRQPMFVFARPDGEPHNPMGMTYRLRLLMRRAKVTGHSPTHAWRHTCGTHLAKVVDTKTIQARLGHASPTTTLTFYVHRTEECDQAAGEHLAKLVKGPTGSA